MKISGASFALDLPSGRKTFQPGTLFVPTANQVLNSPDLYYTLSKNARENGLTLVSAPTGYSPAGPDLGSGRFTSLSLPKILTFAGAGNSGITGEIWYLLDTRFSVPMTIAESRRFNSLDLDAYNVLILDGSYPDFDAAEVEKIKEWVRKGGTVIGIESGCEYLSRNGFVKLTPVSQPPKEDEKNALRPFNKRTEDFAGRSIPGSIFSASLDTTHPLAYGYHSDEIAIFREGNAFFKPSTDAYENPAVYTSDPLLSGYINKENLKLIKNASAIQRQSLGSGKVILFMDDPLFRGYWAGTHKLFMNAVFWGGR
ncbi:MAG TPA: hypothetical protein DC042_03335 [Bacteroidales bacterium]|nr:hypothetical protein [Bacteroidales bacterium]